MAKHSSKIKDGLTSLFGIKSGRAQLRITGSSSGYNCSTGNITISKNGNYTIFQNGAGSVETTVRVKSNLNNVNIILNDVNIDVSHKTDACAFLIEAGTNVKLTLIGTNAVKSCDVHAGIEVQAGDIDGLPNASLNISVENTGSLSAAGGIWGAGIGGGKNGSSGNIIISGGIINAIGGSYIGMHNDSCGGAGIGGGWEGGCGNVTINGGTVNAKGGYLSAGIGGGGYHGASGNIVINGGTVNTTGGQYGKGIGSGLYGTTGRVIITGGSVKTRSISTTPTNRGISDARVYLTVITLPSGAKVSGLSINRENINIPYGTKDMFTDTNEKLYLYLPEYNGNTKIDVTMDETVTYGSYYGIIGPESKTLKMAAKWFSITNINSIYMYGETVSPSVTCDENVSYYYMGASNMSGIAYSSSTPPTEIGKYKVTVIKPETDIYYAATASKDFSII